MRTVDHYLTIGGESIDKLSPLVQAIFDRIEQHGLDAWDSPESALDRVSTWEERAVLQVKTFYELCSSNGRIYPHIEYGLSLVPEFEAVGATETVKALRQLDTLRETEPNLEDSEERKAIEMRVPGISHGPIP